MASEYWRQKLKPVMTGSELHALALLCCLKHMAQWWITGPHEFPGGSDGKDSACSAGGLGQEDPLEKGMATHSSILAWRSPWTEEPGGLESMGSQRVSQDWVTHVTLSSPPFPLKDSEKDYRCRGPQVGNLDRAEQIIILRELPLAWFIVKKKKKKLGLI